ncbi:MAG TPA: hypothetical protein VGG30_10020 [Pirellulales bacterium]
MKVSRLAAQSLNRWLEQIRRPKAVSLVACAAALLAALAGCQSQQTNPGDPFLPFMRTRVPPPGTNLPADSYYQGAPATSAPPAGMAPPAGQPIAPSAMPSSSPDKYAPPGGYNLPQSSIDRSKVSDPATGEVKAGGTAIARRSLAKPARGQSSVDTQLTAAKVTGATAAAAAAAEATDTAGTGNTPPAAALAATQPEEAQAENSAETSAEASTEMAETQSSDGAAVAFDETPDAAHSEVAADEAHAEKAGTQAPLASASQWSAGSPPEQNLAANASTLRILGTDDRDSADGRSADVDTDAQDSGASAPGEGDLAGRTAADGDIGQEASPATDHHYTLSTASGELAQSIAWSNPAPAAPIGSTEPNDQTATLAMAAAPSSVIQTGWNEPAEATATAPAGGARSAGSAARASQAYGYDPSYGWVRGRLEYSASQQQWKLRYIPIDGATDQFGGSVVLAGGATLQGLRAGDFVTAQGRVVGASKPGRGFSPRYEVASIEPVAGSH